ncbi:MAG: hypothetical protein BMS9Abin05_2731 [Rhodothermia bacterium]|nr:MAG: hypothetical protein BMS9Abin05_2731 [Rhodothermia bacterium]
MTNRILSFVLFSVFALQIFTLPTFAQDAQNAPYLPQADPEPFTRGINSIQLVNNGSRWWVVNIFWQGESPNASVPEKYLPQG